MLILPIPVSRALRKLGEDGVKSIAFAQDELIGRFSALDMVNPETGEIFRGRVPAYSVVVPGTLPGGPLPDGKPGPNLYCAVIVKRVDAQTRAKTAINELLRE